MNTNSFPPGLSPIHNELEEINAVFKQAEAKMLQATKKVSKEILSLFPTGLPKSILQMAAIYEETKGGEPVKITFLEAILMRAVRDSLRPLNFSTGFVMVSNTELQNIGLSTTVENQKETGLKLDLLCAEITRVTEAFIFCNFMQWGSGREYPDVVLFAANCNFMEKTIPIPAPEFQE